MEKLVKASLNHLKNGSKMPPLTKGKLRVYSMVFCPYAQRPRLILAAKNVEYETVNINLHLKPDWFLKLNPLGKVPCLHFDDGRTLPESTILCEYLDDVYGPPLLPSDPFLKAQQKLEILEFDKTISLFYKTLKNDQEKDEKPLLEKFSKSLSQFDIKLKNRTFLGGSKPAYSDYMIWPWIERLEIFEAKKAFKVANNSKFPRLTEYIDAMRQQKAVKATLLSREKHLYFVEEFLSRREPNYELGLE